MEEVVNAFQEARTSTLTLARHKNDDITTEHRRKGKFDDAEFEPAEGDDNHQGRKTRSQSRKEAGGKIVEDAEVIDLDAQDESNQSQFTFWDFCMTWWLIWHDTNRRWIGGLSNVQSENERAKCVLTLRHL